MMAIGSRHSERDADRLGLALAMLKLLRQDPQRKYLGFSHGFIGCRAVSKNARKLGLPQAIDRLPPVHIRE